MAAQPMITGNTSPIKLSNVVAAYKNTHPDYGKNQNGIARALLPGLPKEKDEKDYQFDRWLWYWRQHVDGNGNMVSPTKTYEEWQKQNRNGSRASRSTSSGGGVLGNWTFQGPDSSGADGNGVGRINVIAFHPTDVNTYWIGSPGGGAWKTTNNGATWTCMTDQLPLLSISDIKFNPLNPNTVYLCTGDRDGQDYYGIGVLKSYDGGATWNTTGITWTSSQFNVANNMLVNPMDTNSLILATTNGLERSFDGGATWTAVGPSDNFYQVLYCPGDTNIVYATTFGFGSSAQIYRSTNAGMTWVQVSSFSQMDRITVAVTPANPAIVMALGSSSSGANAEGLAGIYTSSDTGAVGTFTEVFTPANCNTGHDNLLSFNSDGTGCGGQGFYDLPIAISPTNADSVFIGGVNTWSSANGGTSWTIVNQWADYYPGLGTVTGVIAIHADKHFMGFNPLLPGTFFESNDGGIYSAPYPASSTGTWNNLTNGLGITEIYRMAVSNTAHYELLGAQDQGSKLVMPGMSFEADGGDGMTAQIDAVDTTVGYTSVYNGYIDILSITPGTVASLSPNDISYYIPPFGAVEGTGGWVTPFVLEPACHQCILAGYTRVYRSTHYGDSATWTAISPNLTTGSGYGDLLRVATTPADSMTIYVAEDGSENIFYTHDRGATWTTITAPYGGYPNSDIKVDPTDANRIWVTYSGYGGPKVAKWTLSGGWSQMNTGLPDVPVSSIVVDSANKDIYIGTDIGVYFLDTTATAWVPYTFGMPALNVTDLEINYGTSEIWASTYGRSMWKSGKHIVNAVSSVPTIVPFAPEAIAISPNPSHGDFTVTTTNIPDKQVTMHLTDANGRIVWKGGAMLTGGKLSVNIQGLIAGTYIFEIDADNAVAGRQKLVIY